MVQAYQKLRSHKLGAGDFVAGVVLVTTFCYGLVIGGWQFFEVVLSAFRWQMVWQNALVLAVVLVLKWYVDTKGHLLKYRLGLGLPLAEYFTLPVFGLLLWVIVAALMPAVVYAEEWIFREGSWLFVNGATNWWQWGQLAWVFGMLHILNRIPVGYCLILILVGFWLAFQYSLGGLDHAAAHHLVYNYINMALAFPTVLASTLRIFRKDST